MLSATALQANSVIMCSESAMVGNTCSAASITAFNDNLQWNALGPATGAPFTNTASATTNLGGVTVAVSDGGGNMILADNYALFLYHGVWIDASKIAGQPYRFSGHFDAPLDNAPAGFVPVGSPGDYLVGTYQNNGNLVLSMSGPGLVNGLSGFAFRIAANSLPTFDVTLLEYGGTGGTTLLGSQTIAGLTGGGNCPGLFSKPPQPCNDAPWIVGNGFNPAQGVQSIVIHTSDSSGFFIDTLYLQEVPEPGTMLFAGIGLLGLGYAIRRRRALRAASRTQAE